MATKNELEEQAKEILEQAEQYGIEKNYFFVTTFERYLTQIRILDKLQKEIEDGQALISKTYVKGRENIYTHPAIGEYNKTSTAANQTVTTLIKIVSTLKEENQAEGLDELLRFIDERD